MRTPAVDMPLVLFAAPGSPDYPNGRTTVRLRYYREEPYTVYILVLDEDMEVDDPENETLFWTVLRDNLALGLSTDVDVPGSDFKCGWNGERYLMHFVTPAETNSYIARRSDIRRFLAGTWTEVASGQEDTIDTGFAQFLADVLATGDSDDATD